MLKPIATLVERPDDVDGLVLALNVRWEGEPLDRPSTGGWAFGDGPQQAKLAQRLCNAINAGVVYRNPRVGKDVNGQTYVVADQTQFFHKRHLNTSLLAVGF